MKNKIILHIFCCLLLFVSNNCSLLFAQSQSAIDAIRDTENVMKTEPVQIAIKYLYDHETDFDFTNNWDCLYFEWEMGAMLYMISQYDKATPHLTRCINSIELIGDKAFVTNPLFSYAYYWIGLCSIYTGNDDKLALEQLELAENIFAKNKLKDSELYDDLLTQLSDSKLFSTIFRVFLAVLFP